MLDFQFYNPTRIYFGRNQLDNIKSEIPSDKRILLTYGKNSIKKNGLYAKLKALLKDRDVYEFSGISANPEYEHLLEALPLIKNKKIDFILAVGGGSVIDGSKFLAAAAYYEGCPWDIVDSNHGGVLSFAPINTAIPMACICTLPATGSEMNCGAVISKKKTQDKFCFGHEALYPKFSILDPTLTFSLPAKQIANGAIDTFVHVTAQYLTYPVNAAVQDSFAEGILRTLIDQAPKAIENPLDYDVRANLMWSSTCATNGFFNFGVPDDGATHYLGHELTALFDLDHGASLAIILPTLLSHKRSAKKAKLLQYAERVWNIHSGTDEKKIDQAIQLTREFFERIGIKTHLKDYGITENDIPQLILQLERHGLIELGEHQDIGLEQSKQIYLDSL